MAKSKLLEENIEGLSSEAASEVERLWKMRDTMPNINEVTLPTLCLYASTWDQVRKLTLELDEEEVDYDSVIERLAKVQKLLLTYMKVLKLDTKPAKASKNKFYDILTKE